MKLINVAISPSKYGILYKTSFQIKFVGICIVLNFCKTSKILERIKALVIINKTAIKYFIYNVQRYIDRVLRLIILGKEMFGGSGRT